MEMDEQHGSSDVSPIRPIQRPQPKKHSGIDLNNFRSQKPLFSL